jgi:putative nucleotidyltransferase with HDIG domain
MASLRHIGESEGPLPRATFRGLAGRAIIALGKVRGDPADQAWVRSVLTPAELGLWTRLSAYDQSHAVQVARKAQRRLSPTVYGADTLWLSAALMHDVGKLRSNLSMHERAIAALASKVVGVGTARRWAGSASGMKRRIGLYLIHGEVGASMIRAAGGREEVAAWTEVHHGHRGVDRSGIPPVVVEALLESDFG